MFLVKFKCWLLHPASLFASPQFRSLCIFHVNSLIETETSCSYINEVISSSNALIALHKLLSVLRFTLICSSCLSFSSFHSSFAGAMISVASPC